MMHSPSITVVFQGNTYVLNASKPEAMREIPKADREQLIELLEVLRQQHAFGERRVQAALSQSQAAGKPTASTGTGTDKIGAGDVDDIMARLILEERATRKSTIKPTTIYLVTGIILGAMVLFTLF